MRDQAADLRNLVVRAALENQMPLVPPPRLIAFSGGEHRSGVTSIASTVAKALAEQGSRVVLVDADLKFPEIANQCGIQATGTIQDILNGSLTLHEVIQPGPNGLQLVPGFSDGKPVIDTRQVRRLVRQIGMLGRHADTVVVDLGSENDVAGEIWGFADDVVVITTPTPNSVMSSYSLVKSNYQIDQTARIHIVVNKAGSHVEALDVHRRINQSCERFRQHSVEMLGWIADEDGESAFELGGGNAWDASQRIAVTLLNWPENQQRAAA